MPMLMAANSSEGVRACDAMHAAWAAYAANPRGSGLYRPYVEAREALLAELKAFRIEHAKTEEERRLAPLVGMLYPLHWIGVYYGADSDPAWCRMMGIPLAQEG